jgi:hypothetical protein
LNSKLENLPHFLDGTILDGNTRVIVTENGLPPPHADDASSSEVKPEPKSNCTFAPVNLIVNWQSGQSFLPLLFAVVKFKQADNPQLSELSQTFIL